MSIIFQSIGTIHTPYFELNTPHQPIPDAPGDFWIALKPEYVDALDTLATFRYIYVLYYLNKVTDPISLMTKTPWCPDSDIGLFASRSPKRPNPIGLSIVQIKEIQNNEIIITGIDAYNETPLLDIKPYMQSLDSKRDANNGWLDTLPEHKHRMEHILGLPHSHGHEHHPNHAHNHPHEHISHEDPPHMGDSIHRYTHQPHNHND